MRGIITIGALNRLSVLVKTMDVSKALSIVAKEIEDGLSANRRGETKSLSRADVIAGRFKGEEVKEYSATSATGCWLAGANVFLSILRRIRDTFKGRLK